MTTAFSPMDFLLLAEILIEGEDADEARFRTAMNRVYYAIFLLARSKTGAAEIEVGAHSAVRRLLRQRGYTKIAESLETLYEFRVKADYYIGPDVSLATWQSDCTNALKLAHKLRNEVNGLPTGRLPRTYR